MKDYSYMLAPLEKEGDPERATVMYTNHGIDGPWHPIAECHPDYALEIVDALYAFQRIKKARN